MKPKTSRKRKCSPLQAIRAFCMQCEGTSANIEDCRYSVCPLYQYRLGKPPVGQPHQPLKAIQEYCNEQCQGGGGRKEVLTCQGDKAILGPCPAFLFRLGVNVNYSTEERERRRQAALKRGAVGIIASQKERHQTRYEAPESSEKVRAIVHPGLYGNNTKNTRQNVPATGEEFLS